MTTTKTYPHYRDLRGRARKAANATCDDLSIDNPRARELRAQRLEDMTESAPAMSAHDLTESLASIVGTPTPAPDPTVAIAVPAKIDSTTTPDSLRLALLARFPVRGTVNYTGVPAEGL
jgi:hypothetical protein